MIIMIGNFRKLLLAHPLALYFLSKFRVRVPLHEFIQLLLQLTGNISSYKEMDIIQVMENELLPKEVVLIEELDVLFNGIITAIVFKICVVVCLKVKVQQTICITVSG